MSQEKFTEQKQELINERDLFGQVQGGAFIEGGFEEFKRQSAGFVKINLVEEMERVKQCQPENITAFADELHTVVCEELGIKNPDQLQFYTAVGSVLDYGSGIDGFFELHLGNGENILVTLDGTESFYKMEKGKFGGRNEADVIFLWPQETEQENRFEWNFAIEKAARMVVENIRIKLDGAPLENLSDEHCKLPWK